MYFIYVEALGAVLCGVTKLGLCGRSSTGQAHRLQELLLPRIKVQIEGLEKQSLEALRHYWDSRREPPGVTGPGGDDSSWAVSALP